MTNFLTLHALQLIPAGNLNRGEHGEVKTIRFGGVPRVMHSSRTWKRAMRLRLRENAIAGGVFATRTRHLPRVITDQLVERGRDHDIATIKTAAALTALGLAIDDKGLTKVSVYYPDSAPAAMAAVIDTRWADIPDSAPTRRKRKGDDDAAEDFDAAASAVPASIVESLRDALDADNAVDLALFGRFLTEVPGTNVDAASSVAHAISVEPAAIEDDFFSTVDDIEGVSIVEHLEVTAPLMYRMAVLDRGVLAGALPADGLAQRAEQAFLDGFVFAMPLGNIHNSAPLSLPLLLLGVTSDRPINLADAFATAVTDPDASTAAVRRLLDAAAQTVSWVPGSRLAVVPVSLPASAIPPVDGITQTATLDAFAAALR